MEDRLRALADSGELTNLPGAGRPFRREDLEGDDARWAAFRIMRNNKVIPIWSRARIDIDAERERLRRSSLAHRSWLASRAALLRTLPADRIVGASRLTTAADARFRVDLDGDLRALNEQVARYNAIVPAESLVLAPFSADALLASAPAR